MESAETEPFEGDPHPTITDRAQAGEKEHYVITIAASETDTFESDAYPMSAAGLIDPQAVASKADGDSSVSIKTDNLELDCSTRPPSIAGGEQVGKEHNSSVVGSGEGYPYATASVNIVGLQPGESKHDETTVVSAEGEVRESNSEAVDVQAGGNDDTMMAAAEAEAAGCKSYATADFEVSAEACTTDTSLEALNMQEKATDLTPGNNEVCITSIKHLEQEVVTMTRSPNMVSNHEGVASPADKTEGDGTFEHIPVHNQEEDQGEEHVFDISEFDLGAHDVPITGTFFGEHCMFPVLDADKAQSWHGSEDDVILMDSSCEHGSDQPSNMDSISVRTSSDTIVDHDVAEKLVIEEKLVHGVPLQTSFENVPVDVVHKPNESSGLSDIHMQCHNQGGSHCNEADNEPVVVKGTMLPSEDIDDPDAQELHLQGDAESSGMNDSHMQGHKQVGGHHCNEADNDPVVVKGAMPPPEDFRDPDAQEMHLQGDAEGTFVSFVENRMESAQPQIMSSKDICNTNKSAEEAENKDNLLNASHRDTVVHSIQFDHYGPESFTGLAVESSNCNTAANEEALHLSTQDTLVGSTVETFKSHEDSMEQAFRNEKKECIESQLNEKSACDEQSEAENDALLNERDSSNLLEAASRASKAELVRVMASSKEEEKIPAVDESSEISTEAVVPVTEPLVQEEIITLNKNSAHKKVMLNNNVSQVGLVVPHMEVDKLCIEEVKKRVDDRLKSVEVSDCDVLDSRQGDMEETVEDRGGVVEDKVVGTEQENEEINEQEELSLKPPVDTCSLQGGITEEARQDSSPERINIVEVKVVGSEQENEEINEQEELGLKTPVDTCPLQDGITEDATQDLIAERINIVSSSDVQSFEGSDGNIFDSRQKDGEVIVEDKGEVVQDKVAGLKQEETEEMNEQEEPCLQQPVVTRPLQTGIAEEAMIIAERPNTASSSDAETAASCCSDFTPVKDLSTRPNIDEERALQSLKPVGEDSKGKRKVGSPVGADSLSKKHMDKHINYQKSDKSTMLKGGNKIDSNAVQAKEGEDDDSDDGCASEPEEEPSDRKAHIASKEANAFGIGDLVWAKVRSHPWWPAQIFDPADASKSARKAKKFGRVLVAFFGDCTFAWLQQSQMIAFRPNFKEKVKQTTLRIFCIAVEEALQEFCRRSELGLSCAHFKGSLHSTCSFPDANTGIREGVRVKRHKDFGSSVQMFRPDKTLEYVKGVACSPLGEWCSLKFAELRGHVYGLRTCMVASGSFDSAPLLSTIGTVPSHGSKLKRPYSSLEINDDADGGENSQVAKKMKDKRASVAKGLTQISKKPQKTIVGGQGSDVESKVVPRKFEGAKERNGDNRIIKLKLSKKIKQDGISIAGGPPDTAPDQGVESEKSLDDGKETLLALAGSSQKVWKRSRSKEDKNSGSFKTKVHNQNWGESQTQTNSAGLDSETAASPRVETYAEDAFVVTSSLSEEKVSKAKVKRRKDKRKVVNAAGLPTSSIDAEELQEGTHHMKHSKSLKVWSSNETKKTKFLKEVETKKEVLGNDTEAGKKDVRKFSRVGDSIRKVAGELTGNAVVRNLDDSSAKSSGGPTIKLNDSALKLQASPTPQKAASKESTEEVSLLQLQQDLELLANKEGGGSRKVVNHVKNGSQAKTAGGKTSRQWQNVPQKTQKSCVQELALAARKRKSEIVHYEVSAKMPKNSSTTHHASKAYIKGAEKPAEHRSFDKSSSYYSRRPALHTPNEKGSSQRYDEKLSSHMPLGLFMRFPEDFPLPSESQLKAAFIPFGPLQMSATRLYHDSTSAQVVFKHGRDAESAMRHAKKNPMFGPVAVTYRLRHLSHSLKVESKADTPNNTNSPTPVRRPYLAKEKGAGPSAVAENRAGNKELGTSGVLTLSNNGSEPTGDIQDQMMTLLRQVSVLVKPSPVGSDGP